MNFEEKRNHLLDAVRQASGGKGVSVEFSSKPKIPAEQLRQEHISLYSKKINEPYCLGRDARYNLEAYEQMTDKEILMSEERELRGDATYNLLERYRKFEQDSRNVRVNARQRAVA